MRVLPLVFAAALLLTRACAAEDSIPIPVEVRDHMGSMVGDWTFRGHEGERTFSGEEKVRLVNNGTALVQEGFFDLGDGAKEHYVILSGWDGTLRTVLVVGFSTEGHAWEGEWTSLDGTKWIGTASGEPATFEVGEETMRYEDTGAGTPWVSEFSRKTPRQ
ncbi:MAG: hypothetical protein AAF805_08675 [Planctomycetota bacterium]